VDGDQINNMKLKTQKHEKYINQILEVVGKMIILNFRNY
jgi:hypothetical protein